MNKLIIAATATVATTIVSGAYLEYHFRIIAKRFPNYPTKVVRKAYNEMMKNALKGKYSDPVFEKDAAMDIMMLALIIKHLPKD